MFGGDGTGLIACCLIAAKLSWQEFPRCIACEALMVKFGSLLVGEESAVRLLWDFSIFVLRENGVVAGVIGR